MVISSQKKDVLQSWFTKSAPLVGLAAENGYFYRWPDGKPQNEDKWLQLLKDAGENLWMESVRDIMEAYTAKTDGAFIEDRESMIIWNISYADPEFGVFQSKELRNHIEAFFSELQLKVLSCKKSI